MSKTALFFKSKSCPVCKAVEPVFSDIADSFDGTVETGEIDITENIQKAIDNGVMSVPTIVFLKDGDEIDRMTGMVSPDKLKQAFENL